ncbi:MAG: response regulator [Burkholderiaceae bacterium]
MNQPLHVLVVDDEPAIAYVFRRYLEKAGFRVTAAHDAESASEASRLDPVDALITDFRMPGASGAELIQRMREFQPYLPAMIVTGYGNELELNNLSALVLHKPTDAATVVACLKDLLADAQTAARLRDAR